MGCGSLYENFSQFTGMVHSCAFFTSFGVRILISHNIQSPDNDSASEVTTIWRYTNVYIIIIIIIFFYFRGLRWFLGQKFPS